MRPVRCRRTAVSIAGASLMLVPFVRPAGAVASVHCTRRVAHPAVNVGGVLTSTATLSGCTPLSVTGGSGTTVTNLKTHVSRTTWAGGRGTTVAMITAAPASGPSQCPKGSSLFVMRGEITGGSGAVMTILEVGQIVSARVCVSPRAPAIPEPGSVFNFNATRSRVAPTTRPSTPSTTSTTKPPTTTTTTAPSGNTPPPPVPLAAGLSECPAAARGAMVTLVNRDRHQTGSLAPLAENGNLDWAARKHSVVMATNSVMSHNGWDTEISESHYAVGPPGWTGQNIAWMTGGYSPDTIESMFFNEVAPNDGHRRNILSTNYHNIGVGCIVNTTTGAYWWSQDFGS